MVGKEGLCTEYIFILPNQGRGPLTHKFGTIISALLELEKSVTC